MNKNNLIYLYMADEIYYKKYLKYKTKYLNLKLIISNKQLGGGNSNNKTIINLFKSDTCGHCKSFMPTWDSLIDELGSKYTFTTIDVNDAKNDKITKKYNIDGVPTIIKSVKGIDFIFNGNRDLETLKQFVTEQSS